MLIIDTEGGTDGPEALVLFPASGGHSVEEAEIVAPRTVVRLKGRALAPPMSVHRTYRTVLVDVFP